VKFALLLVVFLRFRRRKKDLKVVRFTYFCSAYNCWNEGSLMLFSTELGLWQMRPSHNTTEVSRSEYI